CRAVAAGDPPREDAGQPESADMIDRMFSPDAPAGVLATTSSCSATETSGIVWGGQGLWRRGRLWGRGPDELGLDTPVLRDFLDAVRGAIEGASSPEGACDAIRPRFAQLL